MLSPEIREAISNALAELVDRYGTEVLVAQRVGIAQSSINRSINDKTAGATALFRLLQHLKIDQQELVRKYAGRKDISIKLDLSPKVRSIVKGKGWAPMTVFQLEIAYRYCPMMPDAEIEALGVEYHAVNMEPLRKHGKPS